MLPLSLSELKLLGGALALAGVLCGVAWAAHHERELGVAKCQADWTAEKLASEREADDRAARQREDARAAAAAYETQRAARAARATQPSPEAVHALHTPVCPAAGASAPLEFGDVPVPAAVLQRLRSAGADF